MKNGNSGLPREEHRAAIALYSDQEIIEQRKQLQRLIGHDEVIYCRPVDKGHLKCISTRIDGNFALTGIRESGTKGDFYFGKLKRINNDWTYENKHSTGKSDPEEKRFEAWLIRKALCNSLKMPKILENLLFVNSQWRFEKPNDDEKIVSSTEKGKQFPDILAFNIENGHFVVVELKKTNAPDEDRASEQAEAYCRKFENKAGAFYTFFLDALKGMINMYVESPTDRKELGDKVDDFKKRAKESGFEIKFDLVAIRPKEKVLSHSDDVQIQLLK